MTFATFNEEHRRCLSFIKQAVADSDAKHKIVVTHHVPSFKLQQEKFKDSKANGAFTVELSDYIEDSDIEYWIYGHSHYNKNLMFYLIISYAILCRQVTICLRSIPWICPYFAPQDSNCE